MLGCTHDGLHMVVLVKLSTVAELYKLQRAGGFLRGRTAHTKGDAVNEASGTILILRRVYK